MKLYPVIKVDQYAKRGDFKGRGAEKSPYSWCWLDLTRKKVQIVIKRLPAQYWPVLHYCKSCCFNWAGLCFEFVFAELFQSVNSSHYWTGSKAPHRRKVNHSPLRTAIISTEWLRMNPTTNHNHMFGAGNEASCMDSSLFPRKTKSKLHIKTTLWKTCFSDLVDTLCFPKLTLHISN